MSHKTTACTHEHNYKHAPIYNRHDVQNSKITCLIEQTDVFQL